MQERAKRALDMGHPDSHRLGSKGVARSSAREKRANRPRHTLHGYFCIHHSKVVYQPGRAPSTGPPVTGQVKWYWMQKQALDLGHPDSDRLGYFFINHSEVGAPPSGALSTWLPLTAQY